MHSLFRNCAQLFIVRCTSHFGPMPLLGYVKQLPQFLEQLSLRFTERALGAKNANYVRIRFELCKQNNWMQVIQLPHFCEMPLLLFLFAKGFFAWYERAKRLSWLMHIPSRRSMPRHSSRDISSVCGHILRSVWNSLRSMLSNPLGCDVIHVVFSIGFRQSCCN